MEEGARETESSSEHFQEPWTLSKQNGEQTAEAKYANTLHQQQAPAAASAATTALASTSVSPSSSGLLHQYYLDQLYNLVCAPASACICLQLTIQTCLALLITTQTVYPFSLMLASSTLQYSYHQPLSSACQFAVTLFLYGVIT